METAFNLQKFCVNDGPGIRTTVFIKGCPIIPTVNDTEEHFGGIAQTANKLKNIIEVNIEPYHPLGKGKSEQLGKDYALSDLTFPEKETVQECIDKVAAKTKVTVKNLNRFKV